MLSVGRCGVAKLQMKVGHKDGMHGFIDSTSILVKIKSVSLYSYNCRTVYFNNISWIFVEILYCPKIGAAQQIVCTVIALWVCWVCWWNSHWWHTWCMEHDITMVNAQQAKVMNNYKNIKLKLLKTHGSISFNKQCKVIYMMHDTYDIKIVNPQWTMFMNIYKNIKWKLLNTKTSISFKKQCTKRYTKWCTVHTTLRLFTVFFHGVSDVELWGKSGLNWICTSSWKWGRGCFVFWGRWLDLAAYCIYDVGVKKNKNKEKKKKNVIFTSPLSKIWLCLCLLLAFHKNLKIHHKTLETTCHLIRMVQISS
jgi:hypothetical protein